MATKNIYFIIFLIVLISSCTESNDIFDNENKNGHSTLVNPEELPEGIGETIELQKGITVKKYNGNYLLGDICLTDEQVDLLRKPITKGASFVFDELSDAWPNNTIPYTFDPNITSESKEYLMQAMNAWQEKTIINFKPRTNQRQYVIFKNDPNVSSSYVGCYPYGGQTLSMKTEGSHYGTALHELGHLIGLIHEHSRSDRNNYINVLYDNIKGNLQSEFRSYYVLDNKLVGNFDFTSIMLYSSYNSAAIDPSRPTMTKKDNSTWESNRSYLSTNDIRAVNEAYVGRLELSSLIGPTRARDGQTIQFTASPEFDSRLGYYKWTMSDHLGHLQPNGNTASFRNYGLDAESHWFVIECQFIPKYGEPGTILTRRVLYTE